MGLDRRLVPATQTHRVAAAGSTARSRRSFGSFKDKSRSATNSGASTARWCGRTSALRAAVKGDADEPQDHGLGRSRGGLTCKIHVLCDRQGHPLHFELAAGQAHEASALDTVMVGADAALVDEFEGQIAWPVALAGDKVYGADWIDGFLALAITPVIPSKANGHYDARPLPFAPSAYRDRNIVERLIGWMKECRRVFSRYEKTAKNFAGMIGMAFIQRYLRLAMR